LVTLTEEGEANDAAVDEVTWDLVELPLELAHEVIGIVGSVAELLADMSRNGLHKLWLSMVSLLLAAWLVNH
jgi:hypothetical protein